jgi:hypothetical protein
MIGIDIGATEVRGRAQRASVRQMLVERRRELLNEIQSRVRCSRGRIQQGPPQLAIG